MIFTKKQLSRHQGNQISFQTFISLSLFHALSFGFLSLSFSLSLSCPLFTFFCFCRSLSRSLSHSFMPSLSSLMPYLFTFISSFFFSFYLCLSLLISHAFSFLLISLYLSFSCHIFPLCLSTFILKDISSVGLSHSLYFFYTPFSSSFCLFSLSYSLS